MSEEAGLSFREKNAWVYGAIAILGYAVYLVLLLGAATGTAFPDTPYVLPMVATIGGGIVAGIVAGIVLGVLAGGEHTADARDREIDRAGDHVGMSFVVIGALAALVLAMFEVDHFWIANAVYLCFVLSAILSTVAKLVAYRRGLPGW